MNKPQIIISYTHTVSDENDSGFDRAVFEASYGKSLLKSQAYNAGNNFRTFSEMKKVDGRANSLHYKCSFGVAGHVRALNGKIPFLRDQAGELIEFDTFRFELIQSDVKDKSAHRFALHFIGKPCILLEHFDEYLLLSYVKQVPDKTRSEKALGTFLLKLGDNISIIS